MSAGPDLDAVRAAHRRIAPYVHRTPVLTCRTLDALAGARLFFKCENFQRTGSFKIRGATNAVFCLSPEEAARGVVTHSSGNHAAALAQAAAWRGVRARVVMPTTAPATKRAAVEAYGGEIVWCEPTLEARERTAQALVAETGAVLIHPFDDERVVAGQGTAALELFEEVPDLDVVVVPVGGGGLASGTAIAAQGLRPSIVVVGAEPAAADDACRSLLAGRIVPAGDPRTIADGLRTSLSPLTFGILRERLARIVRVQEAAIARAMRLVWERMKIVIEPSSAVAVAPVIARELGAGRARIGILLSGGNVDLDRLPFARA